MKIINCIQGSDEWRQARCGVVTASRFADVMTQPRAKAAKERGDLSTTAESYLNELIGERLSGEPADTINHKILQWGTDHEPIARALYEQRYGVDVQQTGFVTDDEGLVGCSTDGHVGDDIGIEIKCRWTSREHIKTIRAGIVPDEYIWQVQGGMWVTNRPEWHFISYDPRMPDFKKAFYRIIVKRDEQLITELSHAVAKFLAKLDEEQERVEECLQLTPVAA